MQFIKRENSFMPAFSVWSIGKTAGNLLPNSTASGLISELQFIHKLFRLIFPILLLGIKFFEFKFYR
ncbi:hypothetical protein GCM10022397_34820 [Flavivirga jejuensis]